MESLDNTIEYHHLLLKIILRDIPMYDLPQGYSFAFYQKGDEKYWKEIEISFQDCFDEKEAQEAWNEYYKEHEEDLYQRLIFIVDDQNHEKVATATSYYNTWTKDKKEAYLHWVAVKKNYQGKRLSKPLISFALHQLIHLGYKEAFISTQTTSWLAAKLYLDFSSFPYDIEKEKRGFQVLKAIIGNHPALKEVDSASSYLDPLKVQIKEKIYQDYPHLLKFKIFENNLQNKMVKLQVEDFIFTFQVLQENHHLKTLNFIKKEKI